MEHQGSEPDPYKFTGQRRDETLDIDHFYARDYVGETGRFLGVDPIMEYYNPYTYVGNHPLNFIDPLGMSMHPKDPEHDAMYSRAYPKNYIFVNYSYTYSHTLDGEDYYILNKSYDYYGSSKFNPFPMGENLVHPQYNYLLSNIEYAGGFEKGMEMMASSDFAMYENQIEPEQVTHADDDISDKEKFLQAARRIDERHGENLMTYLVKNVIRDSYEAITLILDFVKTSAQSTPAGYMNLITPFRIQMPTRVLSAMRGLKRFYYHNAYPINDVAHTTMPFRSMYNYTSQTNWGRGVIVGYGFGEAYIW